MKKEMTLIPRTVDQKVNAISLSPTEVVAEEQTQEVVTTEVVVTTEEVSSVEAQPVEVIASEETEESSQKRSRKKQAEPEDN